VALVSNRERYQRLREELREVVVVPGSVDRLDDPLGLVAIEHQGDVAVRVVGEALGNGGAAELLVVDDNERTGWVGPDRIAPFDATRRRPQNEQRESEQRPASGTNKLDHPWLTPVWPRFRDERGDLSEMSPRRQGGLAQPCAARDDGSSSSNRDRSRDDTIMN